MPGSKTKLILYIGRRGSGKTERAVQRFAQSEKGVWLDMGRASDHFRFAKDNRLGIIIPRATSHRDAVAYLQMGRHPHFSYRPQTPESAADFISYFSANGKGWTLFIDECQKILSFYDNNPAFKSFLADGRMQDQDLILCCHQIIEVSTDTRSEADEIIYMGPLDRPADSERYWHEYSPENPRDPNNPKNARELYKLMTETPEYEPFYIRDRSIKD